MYFSVYGSLEHINDKLCNIFMQLFIIRFKEMYYKTQMKDIYFLASFLFLSLLSDCLSVCLSLFLTFCDVMRDKG